ncbi:hypothetical protein L228DRAFT_281818 [Xylona heveae TC161]|uniref:Uncharacterized protein n=1 Tax=Xylona heveae (strain CBS 132557 / TC161) TaxID=1328760 RepID=A0A161TFG9_XYLHT|nr:hypothetical protein L228DRAFT_281818 [Xylona heveae TC161]KZF24777.1 hypothetical protein L228DRAFT_281818 [Xylona heveae TC161]
MDPGAFELFSAGEEKRRNQAGTKGFYPHVSEYQKQTDSEDGFTTRTPSKASTSTTLDPGTYHAGAEHLTGDLVDGHVVDPRDEARWVPGTLEHVPWLAFVCLAISLGCMALSTSILVISNGQPVESWRVQPPVILAIASAAANVALTCALSQGLTISWWYKALRGGTVGDLHRIWKFETLWACICAGRHFNIIALATILVSVAVIDGPLLQRASTVGTSQFSQSVTLDLPIAQQLPTGYTSMMLGRVNYPAVLNAPFAQILQDYSQRKPITVDAGCNGTCSTTVQGAGFAIDCDPPATSHVNYTAMYMLQHQTYDPSPVFNVSLEWSGGNYAVTSDPTTATPEQLILSVGYSHTTDCAGDFITRKCVLSEAIVEYPLQLDQRTVSTFTNPTPHLNVVSKGNSTPDVAPTYLPNENVTLGGFALAGTDMFYTNTGLMFVGAAGMYQLVGFNTFASRYIIDPNFYMNCQFAWHDPTDDILDALNEIMFRSALATAPLSDPTVYIDSPSSSSSSSSSSPTSSSASKRSSFHTHQTPSAVQASNHTVYVSHFKYLAGALVVMSLGILSVLPTFNGFWHIGRHVTLSPIETAKAFNAPILRTKPSHSNANMTQLLSLLGKKRVKYGEISHAVTRTTTSSSLSGWGDDDQERDEFGTAKVKRNPLLRKRLEIAHPRDVVWPREGMKL